MTSTYPITDEALLEKVRALALEIGELPSKRAVMRACSVGAPRASVLLDALRVEGLDPAPRAALTAVPDAAAERAQAHPDAPVEGVAGGAPDTAVQARTGRPQIAGEPLVSGGAGAGDPVRRDWVTDIGVLLVGLAAAVITFTTLRDLGHTVGLGGSVLGFDRAWLLPVTVDVAGVVGARVWLRGRAPDAAVRFARALTFAAIAASVVGNAGEHLMASVGITPAWWVVVGVTAVPPLTLAAVVHLGHLIHAGGK